MPDLAVVVYGRPGVPSRIGALVALTASPSETVHVADSLSQPQIVDTSQQWMEVVFSWTSVGGATSYTLQIGTTTGASDYGTYDVGDVLTYTVQLPPGTYYARVIDNFTSTASAEQGPFYV